MCDQICRNRMGASHADRFAASKRFQLSWSEYCLMSQASVPTRVVARCVTLVIKMYAIDLSLSR